MLLLVLIPLLRLNIKRAGYQGGMQKWPEDFPFDCGVVLYIGRGRGGDVGQGLADIPLLFGVGSAVFGHRGGDTVGGGEDDVLLSGVRSMTFDYHSPRETVSG